MSENDDKNPFPDIDPLDPDGDPRGDKGGFVGEFVKKVAVAGLGAVFMGEEGLRSLAGQLKLPKELLHLIVNQADKTKGEIGRVVSEELRRFLQSEKLREEFLKLMAGMTVEIKAEIRLKPTEPASSGSSSASSSSDGTPPNLSPDLVVTELTAKRGRKKKD